MADVDIANPTLDSAVDPNDALRRMRGLSPLIPRPTGIPPISMSAMPSRPTAIGAPSLPAASSGASPVNIAPPLVPRAVAPAGGPVALSSAPPLTSVPKVEAPIPAGAITMPDPNDPRYRPLSGWRAALANLSQLSPNEGIRNIGLRALGEPGERLKQATESAKGNLETQKTQAEIEHEKAETEALGNKPAPGSPEDQVFNDLLTGDNGGPRTNPTTGKPYTSEEALSATKQAGTIPKTEEPKFEKDDEGNIIQMKVNPKTGGASAEVVYHANPKVQTDITQATIGGKEHHVLVNKQTGDVIKDLGAFTPTTAGAQSIEVVRGFDKQGRPVLTSQADAESQGLTKISKATDKDITDARTHTVVMNDMQAKLNDVVASSKALDQGVGQRSIIAKALSDQKNTTLNALVQAGVLNGATDATKNYIQSVLSLRESALGLPKEITGGSRVSEVQSSALWATLPGASSLDSKYALSQAKKFQANIDRLWGRVDNFQGLPRETPNPELLGEGVPSAGNAKYHFQGAKGEIFSDDGKTWYDTSGKQIGGK